MKKNQLLLVVCSIAFMLSVSCTKPNGGPPLVINNGHEEIFYSRDTTDTKAYQLHVTYNTNGSVDILRNEVGAVHAYSANEYVISSIQTIIGTNSAKAILAGGQQYWLVPFLPGSAAISLAAGDTAVYTTSCASTTGGPCQLLSSVTPQLALLYSNPHGCASDVVTITTHGGTYSFNGGAVLLIASAVNIKK